MASVAPSVTDYIQDVKNDSTPTNWCLLHFERPNQIVGTAKGKGGLKELKARFQNDKVMYALYRTVSGDLESKRTKFVLIQWTGESCGPIVRGQASGMKPDVIRIMNGFSVEVHVQPEDLNSLTDDDLQRRLKAAGGADYDTGSNKGGNYFSEGARSIKIRAINNFTAKASQNSLSNIAKKSTKSFPFPRPSPVLRAPIPAPFIRQEMERETTEEKDPKVDVRRFASFFEDQAKALSNTA